MNGLDMRDQISHMLYGAIQTKFIILSINVWANHFTHSSLHTQDRDPAIVSKVNSL